MLFRRLGSKGITEKLSALEKKAIFLSNSLDLCTFPASGINQKPSSPRKLIRSTMLKLPMEVLLRVSYFADLDTLVNLLAIDEFRNVVGSFFNIIVMERQRGKFFTKFTDLKRVDLESMISTNTDNEDQVNLIEISDSSFISTDLLSKLPKSFRNVIVLLSYSCRGHFLDYIWNMENSVVILPFSVDFYSKDRLYIDLQRTGDSGPSTGEIKYFDFNRLKLNKFKKLELRNTKLVRDLDNQKLFIPQLEELQILTSHVDIMKIFSDENFEKLTTLHIDSCSIDLHNYRQVELAPKVTYFKNLMSATLFNIHSMRNLRFEKLKRIRISLGPFTKGEPCVLENLDFRELDRFELKAHETHGYHHEIRNIQAPKLELFEASQSSRKDLESLEFQQISLESVLNFKNCSRWCVSDAASDIFRFNEATLYLEKLYIFQFEKLLGDLGINLAKLSFLHIYLNEGSFKEFPKFTRVPKLNDLVVSFGQVSTGNVLSDIGKYYSHVENIRLYNCGHDGGFKGSLCL